MELTFNPADFEPVRQIALRFPGAEDSISHNGTPSIKVCGKLLCRLHESGTFIPIQVGFEPREELLESHPEHFHLPPHFVNYPYIALWTACRDRALIERTIYNAWRLLASKRQKEQWDRQNP
jgi:hypothetical protein